ncbi:MAG: hypothetical protein P1Q69_13675 [Candidatus Thorarchaeota archaeon]|nr:hypothetical protein [Candidatus Thorarchaeota archaeon]
MKLTVNENMMKTLEEYKIIDSEKAVITFEPGTIWSYIKQGTDNVGVALLGQGKFAVDAIVETESGAYGEAHSGELDGIQFYLGAHEIEKISKEASDSDLTSLGYASNIALRNAMESKLDLDKKNHTGKIDIRGDGGIFLGEDTHDTKLVLVASRDSTVFTYGKKVFVLNDKNMVYVTKDRVSIGGDGKRTIIVDKDGISGIPELEDLGESIGRAVSSAMEGISRVTRELSRGSFSSHGHRRHGQSSYQAWDNVDEFDWDD